MHKITFLVPISFCCQFYSNLFYWHSLFLSNIDFSGAILALLGTWVSVQFTQRSCCQAQHHFDNCFAYLQKQITISNFSVFFASFFLSSFCQDFFKDQVLIIEGIEQFNSGCLLHEVPIYDFMVWFDLTEFYLESSDCRNALFYI